MKKGKRGLKQRLTLPKRRSNERRLEYLLSSDTTNTFWAPNMSKVLW